MTAFSGPPGQILIIGALPPHSTGHGGSRIEQASESPWVKDMHIAPWRSLRLTMRANILPSVQIAGGQARFPKTGFPNFKPVAFTDR
jgi:hypothetical protein